MRKINKVVIHHSAVEQPSLDKLCASMQRTHKARLKQPADKNGSCVAYHYIIWVDWDIRQTRDINSVWRHASNLKVNNESIWIMLSGNLDKRSPYRIQLKALYSLLRKLDREYNFIIHLHREYANKTCPWSQFMLEMLDPEVHTDLQTKITGKPKPIKRPMYEYKQTKNDCTKYASGAILSTTNGKKLKEYELDRLKTYSAHRWEPKWQGVDYIKQWEITLDWWNRNNVANRREWLFLPIVSQDAKLIFSLWYRGMIARKTSSEIVKDWLTGMFYGKVGKIPKASHASTIYFDRSIWKFVEVNSKYWVFQRNKTTYYSSLAKLIKRWLIKPNVIFYVKY